MFIPGIGWVVIGVGAAAGIVVFGGYMLGSALNIFMDSLCDRWGPSPMEELAMSVWIEDHQYTSTTMPCPNINPPTYEEALEYYNWKMGQSGSTESVKIGDDLNTNVHFAKQDKSREAYDQHKQNLDSLRKELKDLKEKLKEATGPKTRDPINEDIIKKEKQIWGEEREMEQKWPNGAPQK